MVLAQPSQSPGPIFDCEASPTRSILWISRNRAILPPVFFDTFQGEIRGDLGDDHHDLMPSKPLTASFEQESHPTAPGCPLEVPISIPNHSKQLIDESTRPRLGSFCQILGPKPIGGQPVGFVSSTGLGGVDWVRFVGGLGLPGSTWLGQVGMDSSLKIPKRTQLPLWQSRLSGKPRRGAIGLECCPCASSKVNYWLRHSRLSCSLLPSDLPNVEPVCRRFQDASCLDPALPGSTKRPSKAA